MKKEIRILISVMGIIFLVVAMTGISAFDFKEKNYGLEAKKPKTIAFDNNTGSVNSSDWWDDLDFPNATQMENSQTQLNIKESWLNGIYHPLEDQRLSKANDVNFNDVNITGDLNLSGFDSDIFSSNAILDFFLQDVRVFRITRSGDKGILIGSGEAGVDYQIQVDGEDSDGTLRYLEDGGFWSFVNSNLMIQKSLFLNAVTYNFTQVDIEEGDKFLGYNVDKSVGAFHKFNANVQIDGDLNMSNNNIKDIENITVFDRMFMGSEDHWLKRGSEGFNGISTNAFAFQHFEEQEEGTIVFMVTSNKTNADNDVVNIMAQTGRNNSGGVLGNSWMVIPNNLTTNLTLFSDCFLVANELGKDLRISCDTSDTGADLLVQDDIQAFGTFFADGGIRAESLASFIMNGNNFDIQNGSLHISTPVTFTSGVTAGDGVTTFNEFFLGGIGSFTNLQVDFGNWFATTSVFCDDGDCANAIGISESGSIIMEANISTTNINSTSLNFVYSLVNILGSNDFTVTVNNNVGSGEVTLLTDSTNNVVLSSQSIGMPSSMWNQPKVSIRFECDVTQSNRECYVDTIRVNGTAISTTATTQAGVDSEICFGDGVRGTDGKCLVGIDFNASANTVFARGNWNISGAGGGASDHSALTNLEWASAAHTFTSINQEMDIISYNLTTNGTVESGRMKSQNWTNVTITESQIVDLAHAGNASWNESLANSLYVNKSGDDMTGNLTIQNKSITIFSSLAEVFMNFFGVLDNSDPPVGGSITTLSSGGDSGGVVGPQSPSAEGGWTHTEMIKVSINNEERWIAVYNFTAPQE